jgi:hypothetical protein
LCFSFSTYCSECKILPQLKVWDIGLLYKLKCVLTHPLYSLLKSYLTDRTFSVKYEEACTDLYPVLSGVPQGSILGPKLYSIYTADLPETAQTTLATYADDTTILASHENPTEASRMLQMHLDQFELRLQRWRIQANETKSVHITFTLRHRNCPPVQLNGKNIPQEETIKYLGLHLDRRLTWRAHTLAKRKQQDIKCRQMQWLIGRSPNYPRKISLLYKSKQCHMSEDHSSYSVTKFLFRCFEQNLGTKNRYYSCVGRW